MFQAQCQCFHTGRCCISRRRFIVSGTVVAFHTISPLQPGSRRRIAQFADGKSIAFAGAGRPSRRVAETESSRSESSQQHNQGTTGHSTAAPSLITACAPAP